MALNDLLNITIKNQIKEEITKERIVEQLQGYQDIIAYWRWYPDKFIDYLCSLNPDNTFRFFFYQRIYLRAVMRHKYVYAVFPRAYSKSFLAVMCLMIKCILYPNERVFSVAGGKEQSASILSSKVDEICRLIPAIEKEIIWDTRGTNAKTRQTKDSVIYTFKNGSSLENVAATEKTRGQRFQSGLMEECVGIDQQILHEVIIPTMNVERRLPNGDVDENEIMNQSQIYITTAGYKNTFSYEKLIQILCQSIARPDQAIVLGGSWRVPVMEKLLNKNFVRDLKMDGTFNEASFEREYESKWSGDVESAFFSAEKFDTHRVLNIAETSYNNRISRNGYYLLGVDVGRFNCTTEVVVVKVTPAPTGVSVKQVVNIFSFEEEHFGLQAIKLKRLFQKYKCRIAVVDGNGLGSGLVDFLVTDQIDPDTDEVLYNWGVYNDDDNKYRNFKTPETIENAMYIMKANQGINSDCYAYVQSQIQSGKIKFLIDENMAKNKLMAQSQGQKMSVMKRAEHLMPFSQTSILRDQMMNLIQENEGANIILKQSNRKIKKDKFSALMYGLYWCKLDEDKSRKKKSRNIQDFMFFSKTS